MAQAKSGDTVRVHYTGTLDDGTVFDSSEAQEEQGGCSCSSISCSSDSSCGRDPLEFQIGAGHVIPGFENAVIGLAVDEKVTVKIPAEEAYGHRNDSMVAVVDRTDLDGGIEPIEGQHLEVMLQDGSTMPVLITEVNDRSITIDANHPLAGLDLTFSIRLVEIV